MAINSVRARSISAFLAATERLSLASIWLAMVSAVALHGSALPRTISRHSSNEPRGVKRGPSGPCASTLSGLPAQRMRSTCSRRKATITPWVLASKDMASMPAHLPSCACNDSGQSPTRLY